MTPRPSRPLPVPTPETEEFWQAVKQRRFICRHCRRCDKPYHVPSSICPSCWRGDVEWRTASGRGHVYGFAIHHRSRPWIEAPYATVMVTLAEGPRVLMLWDGAAPTPDDITVGMPVEIVFEDIDDDITLYRARPLPAGESVSLPAGAAVRAG